MDEDNVRNTFEVIAPKDMSAELMKELKHIGLRWRRMWNMVESIRSSTKRALKKNSRVFIYRRYGKVIGWGALKVQRFNHKMEATVMVYVVPDKRHHGVGRKILEEELDYIRTQTHARSIRALPSDVRAMKFFMNAGLMPFEPENCYTRVK